MRCNGQWLGGAVVGAMAAVVVALLNRPHTSPAPEAPQAPQAPEPPTTEEPTIADPVIGSPSFDPTALETDGARRPRVLPSARTLRLPLAVLGLVSVGAFYVVRARFLTKIGLRPGELDFPVQTPVDVAASGLFLLVGGVGVVAVLFFFVASRGDDGAGSAPRRWWRRLRAATAVSTPLGVAVVVLASCWRTFALS